MAGTENNTTETAEKTKNPESAAKTRLYKIGFFVSLIIFIFITFFLSANNTVTKPFVESQLKQIADNISVQAALSGDEAALTYGDVSVEGGFLKSKISIASPKLEYIAHLPFGNVQKTIVSTTRAVVAADKVSTSAVVVDFPEPFLVEREGFASITLSFPTPPEYVFGKNGEVENHSLRLPPSLKMKNQPEGEKTVEVNMSYASNPTLTRMINRTKNESKSELAFADMVITSNAEESRLMISELRGSSSETATGKNFRGFESTLKLAKLEVNKKDSVNGPYDFNLQLSGKYVMPEKFDDSFQGVNDMEVTVSDVTLSTPNYALTVSGHFSQKPDDSMPFGTANIGIKGLDKFRDSEFVPVADSSLKNAVIAAIIGDDDPALKDTYFTIKREKNSTLFIGESSFENLVGLVITHGLTRQSQEEEKVKDLDKSLPPVDAQSDIKQKHNVESE
jgi:hypothetical protein